MTRSFLHTSRLVLIALLLSITGQASIAQTISQEQGCIYTGTFLDYELAFEITDGRTWTVTLTNLITGYTVTRDTLTSNTKVGGRDCAWVAHFDGEQHPSWLYPRVRGGRNIPYSIRFIGVDGEDGEDDVDLTYTYYFCNTGGTQYGNGPYKKNFYCPYGTPYGTPDMGFNYVNGEGMQVVPFEIRDEMNDGGVQNDVTDYFTDLYWVLPFNAPDICDDEGCSLSVGVLRNIPFLTPQLGLSVGGTFTSYTMTAGRDLEVPSGLTWNWKAEAIDQVKFQNDTRLVVEGTLDVGSVELTDAGSGWDGVAVSGTLDAGGVTVLDATVGVTVYEPGTATLSGSALRENGIGLDVLSGAGTTVDNGTYINLNGTGVRSGIPQSIDGSAACFGPCRSVFSLLDSEVSNNTGTGIRAIDANVFIDNVFIQHNGAGALTVSNALVSPVAETCIEHNGDTYYSHGVSVLAAGDLFLSRAFEIGLNRVAYSKRDELHVLGGGYAFVGDPNGFSGQNAIFDDDTAHLLVYNANGFNGAKNDVQAFETFWGNVGPYAGAPYSTAFYPVGSTEFFPPLGSDPTVSTCAAPGSRPQAGPGGRLGTATLDPRRAMLSEAAASDAERGDPEALREAIRAVRRAVRDHPAADSSAALVGRLYGLHKRDRDDALGERAATRGLLTALRAHLNNPTIPAGLRATAEAAVAAGVLDALTLGEHGRASQVLAVWGDHVEGAEARRVLDATGSHLAAADGDYAAAAALMEAAAEGEPDEAARAEVLAVAALYAERAGVSGRGTVPPGGARVAAGEGAASARLGTADASLAVSVYPNPFAQSATVALTLGDETRVRVAVYDVLGREVAVLADGALAAGRHDLRLDGRGLPAGVYLVRAEAGGGARRTSARITRLR